MLWYIVLAIVVLAAAFVAWEVRLRRPDQLVLSEKRGVVRARTGRFYARHFDLCLPYTARTLVAETEAEAKGRLRVKAKVALSVAPDRERLSELVRVGGWSEEAVSRACKELETVLQSLVQAFCEQRELEEITADSLTKWLRDGLASEAPKLGLQLLSVGVQATEPADREIAEMIQQREAARIRKQTEIVNQQARVAASRARVEADEEIARAEHELQLRKLELRREEEEREAELERLRLQEELERRKATLELEKQEIELLAKNPEVLLLTPQMARLAEASQGLRNARTIVALSPNSLHEDSPLLKNLTRILERVVAKASGTTDDREK